MMKRILAILTVVAMLFVASGVAEGAAPEEGALTLDKTSVNLDYSQNVTLTAANGGESALWTSSDEDVARLSANRGESVVVAGIRAGTAMITCTSGDQQQSCEVTVTEPSTLEIMGVDYPSTYRMAGRGWKLRRGVLASNVDLATLATVLKDANGTVIGSAYTHTFERGVRRYEISGLDNYVPFSWIGAEGVYTWTLSATDVSGRMVSVSLPINAVAEGETVIFNEPGALSPVIIASTIALNKTELSMMKGESTTLTATVVPDGAANRTVMWISSDPSVAVVTPDGGVTGVGIGNATVTCSTLDRSGVLASCAVTVMAEPAISLDMNENVVAGLGMQTERTQGDGINLLADSRDMSGHLGAGSKDGGYDGLAINYCDGRRIENYLDIGIWSGLNLEPNTEYTLSFYMRGSGGAVRSHLYPDAVVSGYDSEGGTTTGSDGMIEHVPTQEWRRYWVVWKTPAETGDAKKIICARCMPEANTQVWICGAKLEKGNVPTEWTPAPEDGRNLLADSKTMSGHLGSGIEDGTYNDFAVNYCDGREIADYQDIGQWEGLQIEPNTEYTLSFYMRGSGGAIRTFMYPDAVESGYDVNGNTTVSNDGMIIHAPTEEWQRYWVVWKTPADISEVKKIICARCMPGNNTQVWICGAKLEKGSIATDWSPALDDVN